jgi:hypothetical protein
LGSPTKSVDVLTVFQEAPPLEPEVQPLRSRAPKDILLDQDQQDLPQASLLEHFERTLLLPLTSCPSTLNPVHAVTTAVLLQCLLKLGNVAASLPSGAF